MAETLIGKLEDIAAVHRGRGAHRDCRVHDRFEPDCWFCQVTVIEDTIAALSQREASREAQGWLIDRAEVMLMSRSYPPNAENIAADLDARTQLGYDLLAAIRAAPAPSCAGCGGRGVVGGYEPVEYGAVFGNRAADVPCPDCRGRGVVRAETLADTPALTELLHRADSYLSLLWHRHVAFDTKNDVDLSVNVERTIGDLRTRANKRSDK